MIEIIKKGCTKFGANCTKCGCSFTYMLNDLRRNYVRGGEQVHCPDCGEPVRHRQSRGHL